MHENAILSAFYNEQHW